MDELNPNEGFNPDLLALLKLRCLELAGAEIDRSCSDDRLTVARRYFEWLIQDESR